MSRVVETIGTTGAIALSEADLGLAEGGGTAGGPAALSPVGANEGDAQFHLADFPIYYDPAFESRLGS